MEMLQFNTEPSICPGNRHYTYDYIVYSNRRGFLSICIYTYTCVCSSDKLHQYIIFLNAIKWKKHPLKTLVLFLICKFICKWDSSDFFMYIDSRQSVSHSEQDVLRTTEHRIHYNDVIMSTIASHITSLMIVYSIVYSDADQRKHQSSASLALVRGIHRGPVNSPRK